MCFKLYLILDLAALRDESESVKAVASSALMSVEMFTQTNSCIRTSLGVFSRHIHPEICCKKNKMVLEEIS